MEKGMRNRFSFSEWYEDFFKRCKEVRRTDEGDWCCLAIDIENFRLFNQIYGREKGDALLANALAILRDMEEQEGAISAHLGQDDFVLFMKYQMETIEKLLQRLQKMIASLGNTVGFLPAIGIYRLASGETIDMGMFDKASTASEKAKKSRTTRIFIYHNEEWEEQQREFQILTKMKKAIEEDLITFYLQPQCRISTQKIVGAEALARWIEKDGTMISPGIFIPALEKYGLIADFDKKVWQMVVSWLKSMLEQSVSVVPISINVSQNDILTMDVVEYLCSLCERYEVPTKLIKVEITESAYAEQTDIVDKLVRSLKEKGFITMLDDFGSGYSSLNMLENVAVDVIKLDTVFVKEKNIHSRKGVTIIESIVNMSKMMGIPIVVEGIETEEQVTLLKSLGCRYAQGYLFYKPMPKEAFETLIRTEEMVDLRGFLSKRNEQLHVREFLEENTFSDVMLNNILGAVAFYTLEDKNLTITRFNEQFYRAIGDGAMESRQVAIQNYVVKEDWPQLYRALEDAYQRVSTGSSCEIRFYKSDGSVFWFHMQFFYLREDQKKRVYYGQVEDVTDRRKQSFQFFQVLHEQAEVSMRLNLDMKTIQYVTVGNSLDQLGMPSMDLGLSIQRTSEVRIEDEQDRKKFKEFFDAERLRNVYRKAIYHEEITIGFRLRDVSEPVKFSTYYIRYSKDQDLLVYAFAKIVEE